MVSDDSIRVFGLVPDSIVDGPGLRYSIFVQGCSHGCPGCHNPESQPTEGGELYSIDQVYDDISSNKLVHAVTFSGGEPFEQPEACAALAKRLKQNGYNIWAYTGYLLEDLIEQAKDKPAIADFLSSIDVLVDGPFVQSKHSYSLKWKGSSNQRLIDIPQTLQSEHGKGDKGSHLMARDSSGDASCDEPRNESDCVLGDVVEWHEPAFTLEKPPSW